MNARLHRLVAAALVSTLVGGCAVRDRQQLTDEVRAFLRDYDRPFSSADTEQLRSRFHDDAQLRWYEDGQLRYETVQAMVQALGMFGGTVTLTTKLEAIDVQILTPTLAVVGTGFTTSVAGMANPFAFGGVMTMLLEKRAGVWKIRHGHTSSASLDRERSVSTSTRGTPGSWSWSPTGRIMRPDCGLQTDR